MTAVLNDYAIENALREVTVRLKQSKFRKRTLSNFQNKCCLTRVTESELLVASHIIPWSEKIETRLDPSNGRCLVNVYDKLFDKGYFTLSEKIKIVITQSPMLSQYLKKALRDIDGKKITMPVLYNISLEALAYHRENIFEKYKSRTILNLP